jgi:tetratricopeptide (TPR) repeat protein
VTPDAADLVARGWARFEAEDLDGARSAFEEAESLDPAYAPAPHGLGWALLRLGELRSAQEAMTRAAARGFTDPDLDAARALVARDLVPVEWSQARQAAERVLLASALYRFNHDPTLDWRDLRLLIAQASFVLGDYPRIAAEIVALGQTPPDPSDSDYAAALLQQLQDLGTALGSSGRYPYRAVSRIP